MHAKRTTLVLTILALALIVLLAPATRTAALTGDPVLLNEVLASHTGTDDTEFFELYGDPGLSLSGLSVIVIESDSFSPGTIDRRFDFKPFHKIGPNGFFLAGNCGGLPENYGVTPDASLFTNYFENSSLTVALVETASLSGGEGSQVTGSEVVLDTVALTDGDADDVFFFDAPVLGPDGSFFPAGARRVEDGVDTDTVDDWVLADFGLGPDNTPTGGGLDGCAPIPLTIPEIQGDGQRSPYEGEVVTTSGVVTLISSNGRDMWIQDPAGDGSPATSDGIFVDDRDRLDPAPEIGDLVEVTATVEELQFGNALPLTQLNNPDTDAFMIDSSGNPLPAPVVVNDLPNLVIAEAIDFWEPLESMRVNVPGGLVVAPTSQFGEFTMLARTDAARGSGFFPRSQQILLQDLPGDDVDYNPERIIVDDSSISGAIEVLPGDVVVNLTGVVDYTFGNYKLQPSDWNLLAQDVPDFPVSEHFGRQGNVVITTFNVENLFDLEDNPDKDDGSSTPSPEELEVKLTKLALALQYELRLPDILIAQEVENTAILQELGDRVNAATGTNYVATSFETSDGRGIEVGFLWDADRVDLLDAFQLSDDIVPGVSAAFGPESASPGREPLVGVFNINGQTVTIVGNHFKSKGGDDPLFGVNWPPERVTETQRKLQARVVRDFVNLLLDDNPRAKVMVAGDLNDFQFGEPGEGADHPVGILEGSTGEVPLTNIALIEDPAKLYTFVFDGNSQMLDHMLVSPGLLSNLIAVDILHFNAGFLASLSDDPTTSLRAADHDPIEGRFRIR